MIKILLALAVAVTLNAELPRRGSAGLAVAMEDDRVVVRDVFPNTPAAKAGLQKGDVIVSLDKTPITTTAAFTGPLGRKKGGQNVTVEYQRGGEKKSVTFPLRDWPREQSPDYDVTYGEVSADGHRLRTITTKPKRGTPKGMLFLVQGLGCASIDNPPPDHSYLSLIASLSRRGYATLRVDKPGAGDSEGGPCAAVDYHGEVRAFRAALASLGDTKNVFLFGHSMGGIQAPLIAEGFPLRGVIAYGSTFNSWAQYTLSNQRRQMRLGGEPYESIEAEQKRSERFNTLFYVQKQPLEKIVAEHPEYREQYPDGKTYAGGKEAPFFQQLYDVNLADAWKKVGAPVLSVYGASDFLTDASEHESLAAAVNSWRPGTAKFVTLEGIDHWLRKAASQSASLEQGPGGSAYDDRLAETIAAFMQEGAPRIQELLRSYYPHDQPGAIVLARRDGEVVLRSAYGLANVELSSPLRPEHRIKIGSVTKSFTAAAVQALAAEGRLKLTDTIGAHLPDWPAATRDITIEQLLTHRGGLRDYTPVPEYGAALRQDATRAEMLELIGKQPPESAPGTAFRYTNSAYFLLGAIVEKVTGGTLHEFVRARFLEPLGLKETTFDEIHTVIPQRVAGYQRQDGQVRNATPYSPTRAFAVGDMISTADDLAQWIEARAKSGQLPSTPGYESGWFVNEFEGTRVVEHGGDLPGFSVHLLHMPEHRVTVAVLSNDAQHEPRPDFVATQIASFLIGKPWDPPTTGVTLSPAEIERIIGTYVSASGTKRTILAENDRLYLERNGRRTELLAAAPDRLIVPRSFVQFRFVNGELVLEQKGKETDRAARRTKRAVSADE